MNFKALQRRSKRTEKQEKSSIVKNKKGVEKKVRKYKKKKRFGKTLNNRAPAEFVSILQRKAEEQDGYLFKIDIKSFKASQYRHDTNTDEKVSLSKRFKTIDGNKVQRDLYSAFLLMNSNNDGTKADRQKCIDTFDSFLAKQENLIAKMKQDNITMKSCFGF